MTALSITASQVIPAADAPLSYGIAGATITAGQVVYLDPTTSSYKLFDANDTAANTKAPVIAVSGGSAGQRITVQTGKDLTLGAAATMTVGLIYVAGAAPGDIAPAADLAQNWRTTVIGVATSASVIRLILSNSGATLA